MSARLAILMYHGLVEHPLEVGDWCLLDRERFREQVEHLRECFDVLPLAEAVRSLAAGEITRPTAAVTFDDGYQSNYQLAFPVLRELSLPATVFLATAFVGGDDAPWSARLHQAISETRVERCEWRGRELRCGSASDRMATAVEMQAELKRLPQPELLLATAEIIRALGRDPAARLPAASPYRMLSVAEIREMHRSGLVAFGAHTESHAILSRISPAVQRSEIERSLARVAEWTGAPCRLFAYPNGDRQDYTAETVAIVRESGVEVAVTAVEGPNQASTPALELRRYGIGANLRLSAFRLKLSQ